MRQQAWCIHLLVVSCASCVQMERRPVAAATLRLGFYQTRKKAQWFGSKDERLYWEQW